MMIWQSKIKRFLVLGLLATLLISGCKKKDRPGGAAKGLISFSSESNTINQGEIFTRNIEVQGMEKIFNAAFDLSYDPSVIEYVDSADGPFLSNNRLDPISFQAALQDGVQGKIVVGLTRLGLVDGVSDNGTLLTLTFRAVGPGTTTLAFADPKGLKNNANQDLTIQSWNNTIVIVQ